MGHDSEYFRRRAAEVRSSAFHKDGGEEVEIAGQLALAFAALARCGKKAEAIAGADPAPLMLRD